MKALILGLGDSGLAMARCLTSRGYAVRVADTRVAPPRLAALRSELPLAEFVPGEFLPSWIDDVQLLALSPGLSPTRSAAQPLVTAAVKRKVEVVGEIELFARELARLNAERGYAPKLVGITGTNGKTTTTRLAGLLIEACGRTVEVAGNIAPAALDALRARLAADDLPEVWVLELSSFQLATTHSLACAAAAVLNVSEDHLDWHGTLAEYVAAKARIFGVGTTRVVNRNDAQASAMGSASTRLKGKLLTFGADVPRAGGDFGIVIDGGIAWLACAEDSGAAGRGRSNREALPAEQREFSVRRLMPVDALALRGRHNAVNALAALALARSLGCELAPMMHALRRYRGEPHRLQLIATIGGVQYYDDSKGTNVGAALAALEGLGAEGDGQNRRRLVLIAGGDGKGQDFAPLAAPLARYARAVVLIGRDAPRIRAVLERDAAAVALTDAQTLEDAVACASRIAQDGDAVLLSPACASLDMFRNYVHRGEVFADAVRELSLQLGQPC